MPEHEAERIQSCAVCGRTILRGERVVAYLAPDGTEQGVCALCRERAEAEGWVRADSAAAGDIGGPPRRRRGLNLRDRIKGYAERVRPPEPPPAEPEPAPADATPPAPPETPERRVRLAIQRFNASDQARVVAGLIKSLGEPQAAVRDLSSKPPRVEVTIAWDLSWYRWEVGLNGDEPVREVGKGAEVGELEGEEPDWNASVDGDGKLRWREGS